MNSHRIFKATESMEVVLPPATVDYAATALETTVSNMGQQAIRGLQRRPPSTNLSLLHSALSPHASGSGVMRNATPPPIQSDGHCPDSAESNKSAATVSSLGSLVTGFGNGIIIDSSDDDDARRDGSSLPPEQMMRSAMPPMSQEGGATFTDGTIVLPLTATNLLHYTQTEQQLDSVIEEEEGSDNTDTSSLQLGHMEQPSSTSETILKPLAVRARNTSSTQKRKREEEECRAASTNTTDVEGYITSPSRMGSAITVGTRSDSADIVTSPTDQTAQGGKRRKGSLEREG
jgi:hypothetical protein